MSLGCQAFDGVLRSEYIANRSMNSATHIGADWFTRSAATGATAARNFEMAGAGGRVVAAEFAATLTQRGILLGAARAMAGMSPLLVGASLAYGIYQAVHAGPDGNGGLGFDPMTDPASDVATMFGGQYTIGALHFLSAADVVRATVPSALSVTCTPQGPNSSVTVSGYGNTTGTAYTCSYEVRQTFSPFGIVTLPFSGTVVSARILQLHCPGYVDPFNPAYSQAAGGPPDAEGKCPTGRYSNPATADSAADRARQSNGGAGPSGVNWKDVLDEVIHGPAFELPPDTGMEVGNVVPYVPGQTTTTTNQDGTVTETATGWNLTRISDGLRKINYRWDPKTTTTTKDAAGNVTGTSTTTTSTGGSSSTPGTSPGDPCSGDPGRVGCIGLGEAPAEQVPKRSVTASWSAEGNGLPAACPAPYQLPHGNVLSFEKTCDAFVQARPVVLVCAAFTALMIVVAAMRSD